MKIFKKGHSRPVRFPEAFALRDEDAVTRKGDERLVVEPAAPQSLLALLKTMQSIDEDVAPIPDPSPEPVDL